MKVTTDHKLILAIDFDGTIVESDYPNVKGLKKDARKVINKLYNKGVYIIIWTCRHGEPKKIARDYLRNQRVYYNVMNEHHPELISKYGNDTRKIAADFYIDDKCIGRLPTWNIIYARVNKILAQVESGEYVSILK